MAERSVAEVLRSNSAPRYSIRAVERALDILDVLARSESGIVARRYRECHRPAQELGVPLPRDARAARPRHRAAPTTSSGSAPAAATCGRATWRGSVPLSIPRMQELCRRFDETINLGTLDGHRIIYLQVVESPKAMRFAASQRRQRPHPFLGARQDRSRRR